MSADNGIYILETAGEKYRVAHVQAIDNLDWYKENQPYNLGWWLNEIFGNSLIFDTYDAAFRCACEIERDYGWTEYGICDINMEHYIFPGDD